MREGFMCRKNKWSLLGIILISGMILTGYGYPVYAKAAPSAPYDVTSTGTETEYRETASGSAVREIKSDGNNEYELSEEGTPLASFHSKKEKKSPPGSVVPDGWYYSVGAIFIFVAAFARRKIEVEHQ